MLRSSIPLLFLVAACGGTAITVSDAGSGDDDAGAPADATSGGDDSSGECFGPQVMCIVCNQSVESVCDDGAWTCPVHSCPADASIGTPLACGPALTCDGQTQLCRHVEGGPPPLPDASTNGSYSCETIPSACEPSPTCTCIQSNGGCQCMGSAGDFTVLCLVP
jgi:hypothetical protein